MNQYVERVVDLLDPALNEIHNLSVESARERILSQQPEAVREVFRLLQESAALAPAGSPRFSLQEMRRSLEMIIGYTAQQGLIPHPYAVDDLFDDLTRTLR